MKLSDLTARERGILLSFVYEQRSTVYRSMLQNIVGDRRQATGDRRQATGDRRHVAPLHYALDFSSVLGVRMPRLWKVSNGTANRRLQKLNGFILQNPRYGKSHANSYKLPKEILEKFGKEAEIFWSLLGYSRYPELAEPKHSDEEGELARHLFHNAIVLEKLWRD